MENLSRITCLPSSTKPLFPRLLPLQSPAKPHFKRYPSTMSVLKASSNPVSEVVEEDVLQIFLKERQLSGDFISRASDKFWLKDAINFADADDDKLADTPQESEKVIGSENDGGFLKLTSTQEWLLGDNPPPMNKKERIKALQDDSDRRKKLNFLKYEALKRELVLLSVGIGIACTGYCLITLSVQASVSYAIGVSFSCLYLQLLYRQADNLSKDMVPEIFMKKKSKKIGIRSEDLRDSFEKTIKGSGIALSSPRLVIPAAIYGLLCQRCLGCLCTKLLLLFKCTEITKICSLSSRKMRGQGTEIFSSAHAGKNNNMRAISYSWKIGSY